MMEISNQQDKEIIEKSFNVLPIKRVVSNSYDIGYIRATHDGMLGKFPEPTHQVAYEDMGNPKEPFKFYSRPEAERFALDLEKRTFVNVDVEEI